MFDLEWRFRGADPARVRALAEEAGTGVLAAGVLLARGLSAPGEVRRFLSPGLEELRAMEVVKGLPDASERVARAVRGRERIWIFGDYDVDGTVGTALLVRFFRTLGVEPRWHIPHRVREGYGLSPGAVEEACRAGADLAITVDNGISAREGADRARALGLDLVITDHHEPPEILPSCLALVNPHQPGCPSAYKELCGAGLAFLLAWGAGKILGGGRASPEVRDFLLEAMGLVALATVADVAPLDGMNRVLVRHGLEVLSRVTTSVVRVTPSGAAVLPGLAALRKVARIADGPLTARDLAFGLGPRLNAAGRMEEGNLSVRLLTTADKDEASTLAAELEVLNDARRVLEKRVVEEASSLVGDSPAAVILLGSEDWHPGVLGIAAARLSERAMRPALLVALDPETGLGKGSGRSVPGFHLTDALARASSHLVRYGGHAHASGFTVSKDALEPLREALSADFAAWCAGAPPRHSVGIDLEAPLSSLSEAAVRELSRLAPHGEGNPEPVLLARGLRLAGEPRRIGKEGAHLAFLARQGEGPALRGIAFRQGPCLARLQGMGAAFDLAFTPRLNAWKGRTSVELEAQAVRPARPAV